MSVTVTPLSARSQQLVSTTVVLMAVMAVSPLLEVFVQRWAFGLGDLAWRYDTVSLLLSTGPQLVILSGLIAIIGAVTGNRTIIRGAAIALAIIVVASVILLPLFLLDHIQMLSRMPRSKLGTFKLAGLKAVGFGVVVAASAGLAAFRAWRASERDGTRIRHQKGEGLVVGQGDDKRK